MRQLFLLCIIVGLSLFSSCYKQFQKEVQELWVAIDLQTELPIQKIFVTSDEIYAATPNEFIRIGTDNSIIERRLLDVGYRVFGRPLMSRDVFFRVTRNQENRQVAEFHLVHNPSKVLRFESNHIATDVSENLGIESNARNIGAFNAEGNQMLLPARSAEKAQYSFFIFDIQLNAAKTDFSSVRVVRRIDVPELPPDGDNIVNIKFLNGYYYVTSLDGAFRISPDGSYKQIIDDWMFDVFAFEGKLYLTGYSKNNFFMSDDNGINWERVSLDEPTDLTMVEVVNNKVLTQSHSFALFKQADDALQFARPIQYNEGFEEDFTSNFTMVFFKNKYYLSVSTEIYYTDKLLLSL